MLLWRKWPAGFNESAIGAAIYGTVRADVDIDPGPLGFGPNAVPLSTVVPIEQFITSNKRPAGLFMAIICRVQ